MFQAFKPNQFLRNAILLTDTWLGNKDTTNKNLVKR